MDKMLKKFNVMTDITNVRELLVMMLIFLVIYVFFLNLLYYLIELY